MQRNQSERHQTVSNSNTGFNYGAVNMLVTTIVIIFVAEAMVMMLIYFLGLPSNFSTGIIDATLLSLLVAPALYFTFLRPMRESFLKRNQSEIAQRRLEMIDEMKSNFISVVTHELRTPVTTIMGYSEIIQKGIKPDQHDEFLELILRKSEVLDRIIDDLETVNRIEFVKDLHLEQTKNNLLETVNEVCAFYRQNHPEIQLNLDLPDGSLLMTYDEVRICQVLENLLSNAVKYSKGVEDKIDVSVENHKDHVTLCVKDKGVGMTQDEALNIYNMFYRAETKKTDVSGLGLGMAIVKNIIQSHNGTIEVTSQRDIGTAVSVVLPKRVEARPPIQNLTDLSTKATHIIHRRLLATVPS